MGKHGALDVLRRRCVQGTALALFAATIVWGATRADAVVITVGSGTDGGVPNTSVTDPNLRVVAGPANSDFTDAEFAAAVVILDGGGGTNPFIVFNGAWLAPIAGTSYVNLATSGNAEGPSGAYLATFTLPAFSTVSLDVDFLVDNALNGFLLNGNPIATPPGGFSSVNDVADVTDPSLFVVGENRLIFRAVDQGGPAGFDFLATITFTPIDGSAVPEPTSFMLLGAAGVGVSLWSRRRKK